MVTKKRIIARVAAISIAAVVAAGLAACSGGGSNSSGNDDSGKVGKNIKIGMNSGLVPQFKRYAKAFEKANKGFHVTVKAVPDTQADYIQQLVTEGLSKSLPDIIFNYDTLNQTLVSNHLLYNIAPWLKSGRDGLKGSTFMPNFLGQYKTGKGVITGIPVSADTGVVVYNKTIFKKYGVTLPTFDWTYDDMYKMAKQITQKSGGKVYGIKTPIGNSTAVFTFYPVLKAMGTTLYDPDSKKFVFANSDGIKAWTKLLAPYTEKFGSPYSAVVNGTATKLFTSGQVAMGVGSTAGIAGLREKMTDDWNVIPMPSLNGKSTTGGGSYSLSISAKSDNKKGAWKFMAWFYSTDGGMKLAAPDGIIPATEEGLKSGAWQADPPPVPADFVKTVKTSIPKALLPIPSPEKVQPKVVPALTKALEQVVLKHVSVKQAYTQAQDQLNALSTK